MATYLARHGESLWDKQGRYKGQKDIPLSYEGERQAEKLAAYLRKLSIETIYTSPVKRCNQTANIIGSALSISPLPAPGFAEFEIARSWQGKKSDQLPWNEDERQKHRTDPDLSLPDGESLRRVIEQTTRASDGLPVKDNVLIVGHQITLQIIIYHLLFGIGFNSHTFTRLN